FPASYRAVRHEGGHLSIFAGFLFCFGFPVGLDNHAACPDLDVLATVINWGRLLGDPVANGDVRNIQTEPGFSFRNAMLIEKSLQLGGSQRSFLLFGFSHSSTVISVGSNCKGRYSTGSLAPCFESTPTGPTPFATWPATVCGKIWPADEGAH